MLMLRITAQIIINPSNKKAKNSNPQPREGAPEYHQIPAGEIMHPYIHKGKGHGRDDLGFQWGNLQNVLCQFVGMDLS